MGGRYIACGMRLRITDCGVRVSRAHRMHPPPTMQIRPSTTSLPAAGHRTCASAPIGTPS